MNPKYARLWLAVFVLVVFVAGMAAGTLFTRRVEFFRGPRIEDFNRRGPAPFARPPEERMIERLSRELDLSDEQRRQLDQVLAERRTRLQDFHESVRTEFEQEQRGLRDAIRSVLTDEQRVHFDEDRSLRLRRRGRPPRRGF